MPNIPVQVSSIDYVSDLNVSVQAQRVYARSHFVALSGLQVYFRSIVDTGAPLSVVPYSLWHGQNLRWNRLGGQVPTRAGQTVTEQLLWQNVPCLLGETTVFLLDLSAGLQTGPHRVVGKFVEQPVAGEFETTAVLGLNFVRDNRIRLLLEGTGLSLTGHLVVP